MSKQALSFNRALAEMAAALNSDITASQKLNALVKSAGRGLGVRGCALMLLDAQKGMLFHVVSHGLSERYIRKGFIEASKSFPDISGEKAVAIIDTATDPRIQYQELTLKENIISILSIPVRIKGEAVGILRAYSRTRREFTATEEHFFLGVSNLIGVALESSRLNEMEKRPIEAKYKKSTKHSTIIGQLKPDSFAHPSEEDFARLLDFYQIEWFYEPRSFILQWDEKDAEMFTPDFYLPTLDLYIEMTTMKPELTRDKRRKVRRLRELHPGINIRLLARRDYDQLLSKYGHGPLAGPKTHGVGRILFNANRIQKKIEQLAKEISHDYDGRYPVLIGVLRGVFYFMSDLTRNLTVPVEVDFMALSYYSRRSGKAVRVTKDVSIDLRGRHILLVEDIVDTGMTLSYILGHLTAFKPASIEVCTLLDKRVHRLADVRLKYTGFEAPDEFLVGYGLDYREEYRNLAYIALLEEKPGNQLTGKKKDPE